MTMNLMNQMGANPAGGMFGANRMNPMMGGGGMGMGGMGMPGMMGMQPMMGNVRALSQSCGVFLTLCPAGHGLRALWCNGTANEWSRWRRGRVSLISW